MKPWTKSGSNSWKLIFVSCCHFPVYLSCLYTASAAFLPFILMIAHFSKQMNQSSINYTTFDMSCFPFLHLPPFKKNLMFSFLFLFLNRSHKAMASLELAVWPRKTLNSQSSHFHLPGVETLGMCHPVGSVSMILINPVIMCWHIKTFSVDFG